MNFHSAPSMNPPRPDSGRTVPTAESTRAPAALAGGCRDGEFVTERAASNGDAESYGDAGEDGPGGPAEIGRDVRRRGTRARAARAARLLDLLETALDLFFRGLFSRLSRERRARRPRPVLGGIGGRVGRGVVPLLAAAPCALPLPLPLRRPWCPGTTNGNSTPLGVLARRHGSRRPGAADRDTR